MGNVKEKNFSKSNPMRLSD
jgi:hypothetical protein